MPILKIEFSEEAFKRVEEIRKNAEAKSNGDLIRDALRIYEWILQEEGRGNKLALIKPNGDIVEVEIEY